MAERYSRLFSLPEDLYTPGAPLLIAAGALLKDNQTGQVLAQLKLRSISPKTITAVKLFVIGYDLSGEELCREEHQYLDLRIARDGLFGAKEAIPLPQSSVRSFTAQILAVYFADGSRYISKGDPWTSLPVQQDLNARLYDTELIRQYRIETSELSRFVPTATQDLWLCTCGEINHAGENCYRCGQTLERSTELLNVDTLREDKSLRLNAEAAQAALEEENRRSREAKLKRLAFVVIPLLVIAGLAAGVFFFMSRRAAYYDEASALCAEERYAEAAQRFEKLGRYKDARERAAAAKKADAELSSYKRAGKLMENGRWDDANEIFAELGDYRDSRELAQEALYRKAGELLEQGNFRDAQALFTELGGYKDAKEIAARFFERLVAEELSYSEECGGPLTIRYSYDSGGILEAKTMEFSAYEKLEDRIFTYRYEEDGSYSVTEGQVEKHYDVYGSYLGQGDHILYSYQYEFYDDGRLHYSVCSDAETGGYCGSTAYDENGNVTAVDNGDGTLIKYVNEYKEDRLVRQERFDLSNVMLDRTSYDYDEQGRLKRTSFLTPGADSAVTTNYLYDLVYVPGAEE